MISPFVTSLLYLSKGLMRLDVVLTILGLVVLFEKLRYTLLFNNIFVLLKNLKRPAILENVINHCVKRRHLIGPEFQAIFWRSSLIKMVVNHHSDSILKASLDDAITMLTPQLRNASLAPAAATRLLERLRLDIEDEVGTKKLIRALYRLIPSPPPHTIGEQLLDMITTLSFPSPIIEELSKFIVPTSHLTNREINHSGGNHHHAKTMALIIEKYTIVLSDDRSLILPVLGSLFDLPLTGQYAASAADLAIEALAIVDEEVHEHMRE